MKDYFATTGVEAPLFLQKKDFYWSKYLEKEKIMYFQFNQVQNMEDRPLKAFCDSLRESVKKQDFSAFVFDLRNNTVAIQKTTR
jgi:hypothetical protein